MKKMRMKIEARRSVAVEIKIKTMVHGIASTREIVKIR
jgi:hypothetical protein